MHFCSCASLKWPRAAWSLPPKVCALLFVSQHQNPCVDGSLQPALMHLLTKIGCGAYSVYTSHGSSKTNLGWKTPSWRQKPPLNSLLGKALTHLTRTRCIWEKTDKPTPKIWISGSGWNEVVEHLVLGVPRSSSSKANLVSVSHV